MLPILLQLTTRNKHSKCQEFNDSHYILYNCLCSTFKGEQAISMNRYMVAQMAEWATTKDRKVPVSIPAWIQRDFASKYMAYLFCIFEADDHDV